VASRRGGDRGRTHVRCCCTLLRIRRRVRLLASALARETPKFSFPILACGTPPSIGAVSRRCLLRASTPRRHHIRFGAQGWGSPLASARRFGEMGERLMTSRMVRQLKRNDALSRAINSLPLTPRVQPTVASQPRSLCYPIHTSGLFRPSIVIIMNIHAMFADESASLPSLDNLFRPSAYLRGSHQG
jgi:hypothetical protein